MKFMHGDLAALNIPDRLCAVDSAYCRFIKRDLIVKIWAAGALYATGWFLIALYVVVTPIVVRKWHFWFLHDAILILLIFGLINTGCGLYLHENGVSPFGLILWIPATLGGVLGYIRGGQWEEFSAVDTFPDPAYRPLADVDEDDKD